ncbi:RNA methyltransferase [Lacibacter luteus]|uniref:RNA methyltransferase n=1 Tax=Lacibacter luteus TaxID=2508719 RepID=A0A4Q1CLH2_9BACT|nr:RNA methyltransferase [Lacibacter luteus]RXK61604.1 RNA methyltransferase [Lacibacter luteus]
MLSKNEVKYIQSLGHKKRRDEERLFLVEGSKMVAELVQQYATQIVRLFATETFYTNCAEAKTIQQHFVISNEELERISQQQTPNQALALVHYFPQQEWSPSSTEWTLVLDAIRDPGNMGTIIRLADWFGIKHIVCSPDCADIYNPKVIQATMGSIMRVAVHEAELTSFLSQQQVPVVGAVLGGTELASYKFPGGGILVIGNEANGIREEVIPMLTDALMIPRFGEAESLNAAIATSIFLWELKRGK